MIWSSSTCTFNQLHIETIHPSLLSSQNCFLTPDLSSRVLTPRLIHLVFLCRLFYFQLPLLLFFSFFPFFLLSLLLFPHLIFHSYLSLVFIPSGTLHCINQGLSAPHGGYSISTHHLPERRTERKTEKRGN